MAQRQPSKRPQEVKMVARTSSLPSRHFNPSPSITRPPPSRIMGRGDYASGRALAPRGVYDSAQPHAGGLGLGAVGDIVTEVVKAINPLLGTGLKIITGFGDYVDPKFTVKRNSILDMGVSPPDVASTTMGNFVMRHREYLGDVFSGAAGSFTTQAYPIQPGNGLTFPWLSSVATNFEQYILRGAVFEFKSTSTDALNSTNTALGTIIMATQYDVSKPAFANKMQMENHQYAMSAKPAFSMMHPIECDRSQSPIEELYIRAGDYQPPNYDPKMYDFGTFYIGSFGLQAATVNLGELWVTYEVELIKPFMAEAAPALIQSAHWQASGGISTANYFGTNTTQVPDSNLKLVLGSATVTLPDIDDGTYLLLYLVGGTSTSDVAPTITGTTNCALVRMWLNDSNLQPSLGSVTSQQIMTWCIFNVFGPSPVLTFSAAMMPGTPNAMDLYVTSVNTQVVTMREKLRPSLRSPIKGVSSQETKDKGSRPREIKETQSKDVSVEEVKEAIRRMKEQVSALEKTLDK